MKSVLVTGGTGFLGNNIVRELLNDGFEVTVAVRASSSNTPLADLEVKRIEVDFDDPGSIADALVGIDTVIHAAALIWFGWLKLAQSRSANVNVTSLLAQQCLERGIRLVHISTVDALPVGGDGQVIDEDSNGNEKPQCNYVVSKRETDEVVKNLCSQGLNASIIHPGLMFGPRDWRPSSGELIQAISTMGFWFFYPTGGTSVCDVRDVARGTVLAAAGGQAGRHYIMAGRNMPYRELCDLLADKLDVSRSRASTGSMVYLAVAVMGGILRIFGKEHVINTGAIQMGKLWNYYSSERAMTELGYEVRDLDNTLDDAISWLAEKNMIRSPGK